MVLDRSNLRGGLEATQLCTKMILKIPEAIE